MWDTSETFTKLDCANWEKKLFRVETWVYSESLVFQNEVHFKFSSFLALTDNNLFSKE